jgi:hypothetical protein
LEIVMNGRNVRALLVCALLASPALGADAPAPGALVIQPSFCQKVTFCDAQATTGSPVVCGVGADDAVANIEGQNSLRLLASGATTFSCNVRGGLASLTDATTSSGALISMSAINENARYTVIPGPFPAKTWLVCDFITASALTVEGLACPE